MVHANNLMLIKIIPVFHLHIEMKMVWTKINMFSFDSDNLPWNYEMINHPCHEPSKMFSIFADEYLKWPGATPTARIYITSWRARRCPWKKNFEKKNFGFFLACFSLRPPMSVHKKCQPNRSSHSAGYKEHIYDCLVLLYR